MRSLKRLLRAPRRLPATGLLCCLTAPTLHRYAATHKSRCSILSPEPSSAVHQASGLLEKYRMQHWLSCS